MKDKIRKGEDLRNHLEDLKLQKKRIVFTNGCFDLLHIGHIRYLEEAKALGDILVVGVNSDSSVRRLKGPQRPITPLEERMEVLSSLECVDYVTFFDEPTPLEMISLLQPHVLVKGGDWSKETTVGKEVVERLGGEVVILPFVEGASTSNLVETILRRYGKRN
jgi:D-beta-D-heptose 7-phosphate kinase/D-beta-D-heptose 1-phosphate adenosyltransferase